MPELRGKSGQWRLATTTSVLYLVVPLLLRAQPSTRTLESTDQSRAEFAINADAGFEHTTHDFATRQTRTAVLLAGIRKTYQLHIGVRLSGFFLSRSERYTPTNSSSDPATFTTSVKATGVLTMFDVYWSPVRHAELALSAGGGYAPFVHSETTNPHGSTPAYNYGSTAIQSLVGFGAIRGSWGPVFVEQDFIAMDFGSGWSGNYDFGVKPFMIGVRVPLSILHSRQAAESR